MTLKESDTRENAGCAEAMEHEEVFFVTFVLS